MATQLDMYSTSTVTEEKQEIIRAIQDKIYIPFKSHVEACRGDKLVESEKDRIFSAEAMYASEGIKLGLIDELGLFEEVMADKFKDIKIENFSKSSPLAELAEKFQSKMVSQIMQKNLI